MTALASILGVGARTPLGLDARQTALFARSNKLAPRPAWFKKARVGPAQGSARALAVDDAVLGVERMLALAAPALREALSTARSSHRRADDAPMRVLLALPESSRPYSEAEQADLAPKAFLSALANASGVRIDLLSSDAVRVGSVGFAVMLERALAHVGKEPVVVGAVDTFHHPDLMDWLDASKRLVGETSDAGFIPSEGAAFVVLGPPKIDTPVAARLVHVASGLEGPRTPEEPRVAELMTDLLRRAGGALHTPLDWVINDVNGERHRTKEWSYATIRNFAVVEKGRTLVMELCDQLGCLGAASGAVFTAYAVAAFQAGFAPANDVLIALASDGDERGVLALEAAP